MPAPRYLAGFLVMAATSWPARSKATHNRWPTKPDAPATSTFTRTPEPSVVRPAFRSQAGLSLTRTCPRLPASPVHTPRPQGHGGIGGQQSSATRITKGVLRGVGDKLREYTESENRRASGRALTGEVLR